MKLTLFLRFYRKQMQITCTKCQSVYKISPAVLLAGGKTVRCTSCGYTWFEQQRNEDGSLAAPAPPVTPHDPVPEGILPAQDDDAAAAVTPEPSPKKLPQEFTPPVLDHQPGGMSANMFGLCVFLVLCFATVIGLVVFQQKILRHAPATALLYQTAGLDVPVPGAGLSFSGLVARVEEKENDGKPARDMTLAMRVTNIGDAPLPYPGLRISVADDARKKLKDWVFPPSDGVLPAGESVPVSLTFRDVPAGATTVHVRVLD